MSHLCIVSRHRFVRAKDRYVSHTRTNVKKPDLNKNSELRNENCNVNIAIDLFVFFLPYF